MSAGSHCCTHTRTRLLVTPTASRRSASGGSDNRMSWSWSCAWRRCSGRQSGSPTANSQGKNTSRHSCPRIEWQRSPAAESPALKVLPSHSPGPRPTAIDLGSPATNHATKRFQPPHWRETTARVWRGVDRARDSAPAAKARTRRGLPPLRHSEWRRGPGRGGPPGRPRNHHPTATQLGLPPPAPGCWIAPRPTRCLLPLLSPTLSSRPGRRGCRSPPPRRGRRSGWEICRRGKVQGVKIG